MKQIIRTLTIAEIEALHSYLEQNPAYDVFENQITMDDLELDDEKNILYPYSWKTMSETNDSTGYNTVTEHYDIKYVLLLTKEQLDAEVNSTKQNAN